MIAAIYVRRSNEQKGRVDAAKAVELQKINAHAFAIERGWTVLPQLVFEDDAISGAEFENRPDFMRMMGMLPRPPFQVLIVSEQKTLGRESWATGAAIKQLAEAGVEIFVGSSRVDLQACKLEYSIVSPK